jgi:hypothetical protein
VSAQKVIVLTPYRPRKHTLLTSSIHRIGSLLVAVRRTFFSTLVLLCTLVAWSSTLAFAQGAKIHVDDEEEMEQGDAPAARENWFRHGRQSPDGFTAAEHLQRAFQQKLDRRSARTSRLQSRVKSSASTFAGDGSTIWVPMGPAPILPDQFTSQDYGPITGRATSVAVDPSDPSGNTVLLGGAFGGAWLSHNAASSDPHSVQWQPVLDQQPSLAVGSVSWSPDGAVMLVGTGEGNNAWDSYYGVGFLRSTDGGASWTQVPSSRDGHGFRGLAIQRMAWSKTAPQVVAASTMFASRGSNASYSNTLQGIYFSADAGSTWNIAKIYEDANGAVQTSIASSHSIAWNPSDHRFYAQLRYHGIYVSRPDDPSIFYRLSAQPDATGAGTLNDVGSCSGNSGSSSCPMYRGEIAINPKRNEIYVWWIQYPSIHRGVWKSTNGGVSWTKLNDSGFTNCGDSAGCGGTQTFFNMTLLAVPNAANQAWTDLFLGGVNLYKCTIDSATPANAGCGGTTEPYRFMNLTHVYGGSGCTPGAPAHYHPDNHDMSAVLGTGIVYFANDGGMYRTMDSAGLRTASCSASQPFGNLNYGMGSLTQFVWGTAIPNDATGMLAGSQDNGTSMTFTGAPGSGQQWLLTNGGDGGYTDIDPSNPTRNWFSSNHDVSIQSCNLGTQCNRSNWGSNVSTTQDLVDDSDTGGDASSFYAPWMLDPQQSTTLLVGTCRVWRGPTKRVSANSWGGTAISPMLSYSGACSSSDSNIVAIAAGGPKTASGSKVIWAALDNGAVWRTLDSSVAPAPAWRNVTPPSAPSLPVSSIALDPHDGTGLTAYITYQGFGTAHLWHTTDGGITWAPAFLNSGLPDAPFNNVVVDPDDGSVLYVATDIGVYSCEQTSNTCQEVGPASNSESTGFLPNVPVLRAVIQKTANPARKLLKAVTYGRGAWMADITSAAAPPEPGIAHVSVTNFAFGGQPITVSKTLSEIITNTGSGPLTISAITASGSGFSQTNGCGSLPISVAPNGKCIINLAYKPGATGSSSGTLAISHNGSNTGTILVPLSGVGEDFVTSVTSPSSTTVSLGASIGFGVTASPTVRSFDTGIVFSCATPLPRGITCSFDPAQVTPGSGTGQTTLTVATTRSSTSSQHAAVIGISAILGMGLAMPGMLVLFPVRKSRNVAASVFIILISILVMSSCGGGGSYVSKSGAAADSGTQPGTYQITVMGNAGGLVRTSQISITVQ